MEEISSEDKGDLRFTPLASAAKCWLSGVKRIIAASFSHLQDVQAGVGAVDDVDVAAVVDVDIVGLDRDLAALARVRLDAALVGLVGGRRVVEDRLLRVGRVA